MSIELKMPALSPTMEDGTLAKWLFQVGDVVRVGDLLAEIETDKATMEFESVDEGRLSEILVSEGSEGVKVGTVIARLIRIDVQVVEPDAAGPAGTELPAAETEMRVARSATEPAATPPVPLPRHDPLPAPAGEHELRATPLARRIAHASGIDLAGVSGSGAGGRIMKADLRLEPIGVRLEAATPQLLVDTAPLETPIHAVPVGIPYDILRLSGMRKTIARRLTLSKQTVPHFYLSIDCQIDMLIKLRSELNSALAADGVKLSVNDFLIKALARALEEVPEANVQFAGSEIYRFGRVDVSVAVALDDGLVTPVIADAGTKRLSVIAREARSLASQAREGKLLPEQYQGGTVSLSNLGMFGIERIFPVINPPQAMILGIGAGEERVRAVDGHPIVATMLSATASFDHRAINGAIGARTMAALRALIEEPIRLLA